MIGFELGRRPLEILCLGAHPDDVEIGCGATLLTLAGFAADGVVDGPANGSSAVDSVAGRAPADSMISRATVFLLTGTPERIAEARAASSAFLPGIDVRFVAADLPDGRLPAHWDQAKNHLETLASTIRPDVILCPRSDDAHQDHRLLAELVSTVWRDCLILRYEIPKWDGDTSRVSHYVPVTNAIAARKVALLNRHYPSQAGRDWWTDDLFLGLLRLRGMQCRHRYAEAFTVEKAILHVQPGVRA